MARLRNAAITWGAFPVLTRDLSSWQVTSGPSEACSLSRWLRTQAAGVAGSALRSLVMRQATSTVFWPFLVTVRPSCATWAAASDSVQAGASTVLMVRRARRPWSALPAEWRGWRPRAAFSAAGTASACWPGRSSRSRRLADDELRRVVLRVPCADRDNRGGAAGERFQQVPHRGSFVRFRVHGNLPGDCADAVGQCRSQVRGLPRSCLRAAGRLCRRSPSPAEVSTPSGEPRTTQTPGMSRLTK
jgi:hypothetical protein